ILNHIGWESWREVLAIAREHPNVMVETSWQPAAVIRRATDRLGAERVLFGSDYPMFQEWQALREVKEALSPAEYELVVSKNAVSLLGLEPGVHNMTRSAAEAAGERRI
ncbi:MAG TPA: amidohydrolase family protein, partial [Candidatus Obscuribacterales bacterium]